MSDSDKDSGSGSGSDHEESGSQENSGSENESGSGSGGSDSGSDSGSGSGSDSGSGSGSDSDSSSGKKKGKKKKGKENAIDEASAFKPKTSVFFELQGIMRSILFDLNTVEKKVTEIEMRFNPKPIITPQAQQPPKRASSQRPTPTRNYFPPGYTGNQQVHFEDGNVQGILKPQGGTPQQIVLQPSEQVSEFGGTVTHSHGRASSAHYQSNENLSSYQQPMIQPALPYPAQAQMSAREPRQPYQIQQVLPANFGRTGPYTKYLKTAQNPEPTYTNRFFQHQPMQMRPMTSRFANTNTARGSSPGQPQQQLPAGGTARNYSYVHNQQQFSARPPTHSNRTAPGAFQQATTMQDYGLVPQAAVDMMTAHNNIPHQHSASNTNLDSQETARQYQQPPIDFAQEKKMAGPPPGVGSAVDRVNLAQIENAIDCLLAQ